MFGRKKRDDEGGERTLATEHDKLNTARQKAVEEGVAKLHKDARKAVEQNLAPGELILVVIRGAHDQAIIGTQRRALVFKRGSMGGARGGTKVASWEYRHVHGVQIEHGKAAGLVMLSITGTESKDRSYWDLGKDSVQQSPYGLSITKELFDQAQAGVVTLRQLISAV